MRDNTDTKVKAKNASGAQRLLRAAIVSVGVVIFLFIFRPFGLEVDSMAEALVLLGVAPINLLLMLAIHGLPFRKQPWHTVVALCILVVGNTLYLAAWSQRVRLLETILAITLVVGLTTFVVFLWTRGRIPEQEIGRETVQSETLVKPIILAGDGGQEILKMAPDELLFVKANGNYVDVHYMKDSHPAKSMLRSSLMRLAAQIPEDLIIQCHRSYFVNLATARRIIRAKGRTFIEFDSGDRVPVSRKFAQDVLRSISA